METVEAPAPAIWWLHPGALFTLVSAAVSLSAWLIPPSVYLEAWNTPKYFDDLTLLYALTAAALFTFGTMIMLPPNEGGGSSPHWKEEWDWNRTLTLFRVSCRLCYTGYLIWLGAAIFRGVTLELILGVLTGEPDATYTMKDIYLVTLGGLTTLTQFGIAAMILGCALGASGHWRAVRTPLLLVLLLSVVRAIMNSERLAVIELVVPAAAVLLQLSSSSSRLRRHRPLLFSLLPLAAVAGVFLLFTASEYLRSWVNFYAERSSSIWEFAAIRLSGYYVTATNNSAYLLSQSQIPTGIPYFTTLFLWKFPLVNEGMRWLFPGVMNGSRDIFTVLLESSTNPEFNNNGGLLLPMIDYDIFGGWLYWLLAGTLCGWYYRQYRRSEVSGIVFYPILMLSILESPRIIYWAEGRVFPILVVLALSTPFLRSNRAAGISPEEPCQG